MVLSWSSTLLHPTLIMISNPMIAAIDLRNVNFFIVFSFIYVIKNLLFTVSCLKQSKTMFKVETSFGKKRG